MGKQTWVQVPPPSTDVVEIVPESISGKPLPD